MQKVLHFNSRTQAPGQGTHLFVLALPGVSGFAWRTPPPLLLSSIPWPSKGGQNHLASHSYWRTCSLGLDDFLAFSGPDPTPSLSLSFPLDLKTPVPSRKSPC